MLIYLLGFMGSGKSTIGRRLGSTLEMPFYDLDRLIELSEQSTVSQIFSEKGEEYFRQAETNILRQTAEAGVGVIACGGGTPCFHGNIEFMNQSGITVYLEMSVGQLYSRLRRSGDSRPLISGLEGDDLRDYIKLRLEERSGCYKEAKITIPGLDPDLAMLIRLVQEKQGL